MCETPLADHDAVRRAPTASLVTQAGRFEAREPNDVGPGASRRSTATPMRGAAPRSTLVTPHELRPSDEQGCGDYIPRYPILSSAPIVSQFE